MTYELSNVTHVGRVLSHTPVQQYFVYDHGLDSASDEFGSEENMTELLARARAQSGDYFDTLATELDKIAQSLALAQAPEAPEIERLVHELLYVGRNFKLVKSTPHD